MTEPAWATGPLAAIPAGHGPVAWLLRLDDAQTAADARRAAVSAQDLADLADRPQAAMRALRRRLAKALIARMAGVHPDLVRIARNEAGAPIVIAPDGWHVSVAGRWPLALIGVARIRIGVDVEPLDAPPPPPEAFTIAERATMREDQALARWVTKEAHAKRLGIASRIAAEAIETRALGGLAFSAASAEGGSLAWCVVRGGAIAAAAIPA